MNIKMSEIKKSALSVANNIEKAKFSMDNISYNQNCGAIHCDDFSILIIKFGSKYHADISLNEYEDDGSMKRTHSINYDRPFAITNGKDYPNEVVYLFSLINLKKILKNVYKIPSEIVNEVKHNHQFNREVA